MREVRVWIMVTNRGGEIKIFSLFTFTYVRGGLVRGGYRMYLSMYVKKGLLGIWFFYLYLYWRIGNVACVSGGRKVWVCVGD